MYAPYYIRPEIHKYGIAFTMFANSPQLFPSTKLQMLQTPNSSCFPGVAIPLLPVLLLEADGLELSTGKALSIA